MSQNRYRTARLLVAVALAIVLLPAGAALAQSQNGTLRGIVKDTTGAVIPGATVTIINEATNDSRNMVSTSDGTFNFPALQLGDYTVAVELAGFDKYVQTHVSVKANQVTDVTATMQVGQVSNTVEVTSGSDMVQTTTTQAGGTIRDQAIEEVPNPTLDGSPLNLAIIFPNTTTMPGGTAKSWTGLPAIARSIKLCHSGPAPVTPLICSISELFAFPTQTPVTRSGV